MPLEAAIFLLRPLVSVFPCFLPLPLVFHKTRLISPLCGLKRLPPAPILIRGHNHMLPIVLLHAWSLFIYLNIKLNPIILNLYLSVRHFCWSRTGVVTTRSDDFLVGDFVVTSCFVFAGFLLLCLVLLYTQSLLHFPPCCDYPHVFHLFLD